MPQNPITELCNSADLFCLELEIRIRRHRVIRALNDGQVPPPSFEQLGVLANVDETLRKAQALVAVAAEHARKLQHLPAFSLEDTK